MKSTLKQILFISFLTLISNTAYAHRVNVFAWVEDHTVFVESKFAGGKQVKKGDITITDISGNTILAGKTDKQGKYSFKVKKEIDYIVIVNAGGGHKGEWKVNHYEFSGDHLTKDVVTKNSGILLPEVNENQTCLSEDQLNSILDQKLKSIHGQLKSIRQNSENKIRDLISGVGFILGLFGIFALMKSRKNQS